MSAIRSGCLCPASTSCCACDAFNAVGFSQRTCLPASSAREAISRCSDGGVTIVTRSMFDAINLRQSSNGSTSSCSAILRVRSGSCPAIATTSRPASRNAGTCTRAPHPVPMIPTRAMQCSLDCFRGHRRTESAEKTDQIEQLGDVKWLFENDGGFEVFVGRFEFVGRDHDDRRFLAVAAKPAQPLAAVHARHGQIEDDQEDVGILLDDRNGVLPVAGGEYLE